jgi:serine protease Do
LILDPKERATVIDVEAGTPAAAAGFQKGDAILALDGQSLLSIADVQWVLHQADSSGAELKANVLRNGKSVPLTLTLKSGWRQRDDISWRASTWGLRRMATGGLLLEDPAERPAGLSKENMALRIKHVGQFGPHAAAKNAGFQVGDIIVSFDGKTDLKRETDLLAYSMRSHKPGDKVPVVVFRGGKNVNLTLPMQE